MLFSSGTIFICVYLIVTVFAFVQSQEEKWDMDSKHDCELSDDQWNLIVWYFERVGYLEITQIVHSDHQYRRSSRFANYAIKKLSELTLIEYLTFTVDYNFKDEDIPLHSNTYTYTWNEENFEPEPTHMYGNDSQPPYIKTPWIQDTFETAKSRFKTAYRVREDEPEFGNVVIAESIQVFDNYINGAARHPFEGDRANYVLIVHKEIDTEIWNYYASNIMAKLWKFHRILNAIILSTCHQTYVGYYDPYINVEAFNLSQYDKWGMFRSVPLGLFDLQDDWIMRKEWSLNGYPFVATIFSRYPTLLVKRALPETFLQTHYARGADYSNGYGGFDGFVMGNLAKALNFDLKIIMRMPQDTYGNILPNHTFTGTLADVLYGRAEASFNARFLLDYGTSKIEFMFPVIGDKMCVIAPAAQKIPQWTAIFKCFSVNVWASFAVMTSISGIIWYFLKNCKFDNVRVLVRPQFLSDRTVFDDRHHPMDAYLKQPNDSEHGAFVRFLLKIYEIFIPIWLVMLGATTIMPERSLERLFISSCLLAHIIILGTFEGSLYTSFSTSSYYKNIDTLTELDKSGLPIVASSHSLRNLFGSKETESPLLRSLSKKYRIERFNVSAILRAAYSRDMCGLERYLDINSIIRTNYQRTDGSKLLHVVKECPRDYFLSYLVRRGWPLLPRFNNILKRFAEAGFLGLWYQQTENAFTLQSLIHNPINPNKHKKQAFSLKDMQTAFYILVIGHLLSIIIFVSEFFLPPSKKYVLPYIE